MTDAARGNTATMALFLVLALTPSTAFAMNATPSAEGPAERTGASPSAAPAATTLATSPEDVASLDAILAALYDVISGPAGEARDWDRFRSLFIEGARLIPTGRNANGVGHRVWSPDEYIAQAGASLEEGGFFEVEIGRTTETFGNVTHAFSAYASRRTLEDAEPFARGINSIQLLNAGDRWWIVSVFWDSEREGNPIPGRYIGG